MLTTSQANPASWIRRRGAKGLAYTPVGGIPARTGLTAPFTWGYSTCDLVNEETGDFYSPNRTATIHNSVLTAIGGSKVIQFKQIGAKYFVTGKLMAVDERLQKTRRVQYSLFIQIIEVETGLLKFQNESARSKALKG